jgi:glycosyltransferase involved in cell wall biosynthesis
MRIVIDLQGGQGDSRFRGIGRYSLDLALAIAKNRGPHEVIIALSDLFPDTISDLRAAFHGILPHSAIRVWTAVSPVASLYQTNTQRRAQAELIRETFLAALEPDVVLIASLFEGFVEDVVTTIGQITSIPTAVILYDLIPLIRAATYLSDESFYKLYMEKVGQLKKADHLLSISSSAGDEAVVHLAWDPARVTNISTAANPLFRPLNLSKQDESDLCAKYDITRKVVLYTGGLDSRKNVTGLVKAFAGLNADLRKSYQLIIVGKAPPESRKQLGKLAAASGLDAQSITMLDYLPDDDLVQLYNVCEVFVLPSFHEGFGLPALEAMQCGSAVIASNLTSLPEVLGREDALFDPADVASITAKLHQVLSDVSFRQDLERHGLEQAKKFNWDITAQRAIAALATLHQPTLEQSKYTLDSKLDTLVDRLAKSPMRPTDCIQLAIALSISFPEQIERPRIFVDVSTLAHSDAQTGIQRVVRSVLAGLFNQTNNDFEVLPVRRNDAGYYVAAIQVAQTVLHTDLGPTHGQPIAPSLGDVFLGLDLDLDCPQTACAEIDKMRRLGTKVLTVVYDLLPVQMPSYFPKVVQDLYPIWLERLTSYDGAICISRAVADDLRDWTSKNITRKTPFQIGWFHLGCDVESSIPTQGLPKDAAATLHKLGQAPTFLMVGTIEPRKGYREVLAAFDLLWAQGLQLNLVIVGKEGWDIADFTKTLPVHPQWGKQLFWQNSISDEYLAQIYATSTCLIAASEGEGFGLPLIEAAQHKIPILARDLPVFQEVAGTYATYFSGRSPDDLALAIQRWLDDWKADGCPKSDDMPKQTWAESSSQLFEVILGWLRANTANLEKMTQDN